MIAVEGNAVFSQLDPRVDLHIASFICSVDFLFHLLYIYLTETQFVNTDVRAVFIFTWYNDNEA